MSRLRLVPPQGLGKDCDPLGNSEPVRTGKATRVTAVFAFGVFVLEITCGRCSLGCIASDNENILTGRASGSGRAKWLHRLGITELHDGDGASGITT
jgi:hypothetical protein